MTKTPTAVYRCLQPELAEAYAKASTEKYAAFRKKCDTLQEEWGVEGLTQISNYEGVWITGYHTADYKETPKPGFRKDRDTGYMVPAKRTPEGKAIVERLKGVSYIPGKQPGLPSVVWGQGFMGPMVIKKLNGSWYGYTTVPLRQPEPGVRMHDSLSEVDPAIWEPVKLSTYFMDQEFQEEADSAAKEEASA